MYVCVCAAVTERQVDALAERGIKTLSALREEFGLENPCGKCTRMLREILERRPECGTGEPPALGRV